MALKYVIPTMDKTFGILKFAGAADAQQGDTRRTGGRQSRTQTVRRRYNLFSTVLAADDIEVILPGKAGTKAFEYDSPVKLVNPRIEAAVITVGTSTRVNYILYADDMLQA